MLVCKGSPSGTPFRSASSQRASSLSASGHGPDAIGVGFQLLQGNPYRAPRRHGSIPYDVISGISYTGYWYRSTGVNYKKGTNKPIQGTGTGTGTTVL